MLSWFVPWETRVKFFPGTDNNANSIDFSNYDHEVKRANSIDYDVGITVSRDLDHGSIEASGVWANRDFDVSRQYDSGENAQMACLLQPEKTP